MPHWGRYSGFGSTAPAASSPPPSGGFIDADGNTSSSPGFVDADGTTSFNFIDADGNTG